MAGLDAGYRNRLFHALHAEARKRRLDHDALHDLCATRFGVHSMGDATTAQLLGVYREWTGKTLKRRARLGDPDWQDQVAMVSGEEVNNIANEFAKRGLGLGGQKNFIRRQLRGRDVIRTHGDYVRVMHGLRAMNLRDAGDPNPGARPARGEAAGA